jgi:hypothetical protein
MFSALVNTSLQCLWTLAAYSDQYEKTDIEMSWLMICFSVCFCIKFKHYSLSLSLWFPMTVIVKQVLAVSRT